MTDMVTTAAIGNSSLYGMIAGKLNHDAVPIDSNDTIPAAILAP